MIKDIQKYDASHFLLGHESICDIDEMNVFWQESSPAAEPHNPGIFRQSHRVF